MAVTDVSLNSTSISLTVGQSSTLIATVTPANATNKNVSWSSSNSSVVSVANGTVRALSEGSSTITVKTEDGGKTATCQVTVAKKEEEPNPPAPSSGNDFTGRVAAGSYGSGIIRNDGDVYTTGKQTMPYPQEAKTTLTPTKVEGISNARSLNNDMDYYVASTKDNHFYGWGTRSFAKEAEYDLTPVLWDKFNDSKLAYVKDMEATTSFASITNNGNVLMNGRADNNHLGQGDGGSSEGFVTDPVTVKGLSNITQLGLGNYHTVALTNGGSVYTWGKIKRGWADEQDTFNTGTPKKVSQLSNVVSVDANSCACAAVDKNGNLYMWGNPQDSMYFGSGIGLFGDGGSKDYVAEPKKVEGISNVKSIKMTDIFCAAITNDGTLYMWGNNSGGQLATGNKENKLVPTKVEGISNVSYVDLGKNHTIAVTDNGDVYTWGNNDSGQLGDGTNTEKLKPTKIESGLVAFD